VRLALLAVVLSGCAVCHAPRKPDVPPGVEATAFIDQGEECWTIDVRPEGIAVLRIIADVLHLVVGATDGG
jgi:hypothetical protein